MEAMLPLLFAFAIVLAIILIIVLFLRLVIRKEVVLYEKHDALMTPAECQFFIALEGAVGSHYHLFTKVRLADILRVKKGLTRSAWQSAFNAIKSKHIDFLACDPNDLSILFVVELDDATHQRKSRQERDAFVDRALIEAGVPIFRFEVKRRYSLSDIRNRLLGHPSEVG